MPLAEAAIAYVATKVDLVHSVVTWSREGFAVTGAPSAPAKPAAKPSPKKKGAKRSAG